MQTESIVLLIDPSEEDRADIRSILESRPVNFIEANTASEAWEKVSSAREFTMMIAGISVETAMRFLISGIAYRPRRAYSQASIPVARI